MSSILWMNVASDTGAATTRDFLLHHNEGCVPGAVWLPVDVPPKALILVGHGGSRHKRELTTLTFIKEAVERRGFAVAAIDGPLHGARRGNRSLDPSKVQKEFLDLWQSPGNGISGMCVDWEASLTTVLSEINIPDLPVGYFGLSMGTAYGLPLIATDARIDAAVIGMWGANYPNSNVLVKAASEIDCPVLFLHKSDDNFFSLEGALEIYDSIIGEDKRFIMNPGPHSEATSEQIETALSFFSHRL